MAISLLTRLQDEYLTCQICRTYYTKPKALPCLHTFCATCLQHYIRLNLSRHLPCPMCRKKFRVPRKGVDAFPTNHMVNGISELLEAQSSGYQQGEQESGGFPRMIVVSSSSNPHDLPSINPAAPVAVTSGVASSSQLHPMPVFPPQGSTVTPLTPVNESTTRLASLLLENSLPSEAALTQNVPMDSQPQSTTIAYWVDSNIPDPNLLHKFGHYGAGMADFTNPLALATSPKGEVVIADMRENRIIVYDRNGKFCVSFQCVDEIRDVAVMSNGIIVVAAAYSETAAVIGYNMAGEQVMTFKKSTIYDMPHGVAVNAHNHIVLTMLDSGDLCVVRDLSNNGSIVRTIYNSNLMKTPFYVATDSALNVLVSDSDHHAIHVFNQHGTHLFTFGSKDHNPDDLKTPRGLCTDYRDNVIVADSGHQAVKLFNPKGKFLRTLVQLPGVQETGFSLFPIDVSVRNFDLFVLVVGPYFSQVRVYTYRPLPLPEDTVSAMCTLM